jgi:predicted transcriptional regulator
MITVRLTEDLEARLNQAVKQSGCSRSQIARDAIAHRIAYWEDELLLKGEQAKNSASGVRLNDGDGEWTRGMVIGS